MHLGRNRPPEWKVLLPLILAPLVLLAPVLFTGKALFWGTPYLQFTPWRWFAWETVAQGHLPLWNPWVGMGAPLAANYQSALFYPPNWLLIPFTALGGAAALAWAQTLLVALHLAWAAVGMAWLVKRLGLGALAQTVGGLAYGLCGYLVARSGFLSINAAAAWLPWILLASGLPRLPEEAPRRALDRRALPLAACIGLLLLAGHAQTAWYTLLLLGLWAAFWGWLDGGWRLSLAALLGLALPVLGGAALAAVQLLPTGEYLLQSQRADAVDYTYTINYSFWPWRFLTLLAPDFFGNPARGAYWVTADNYWEDAVYIGLLPLWMALAAVLRRRRPPGDAPGNGVELPRALTWFLLAVSGVAFLLALGRYTPVFPFLYRHVPTFDMFQAPARWTIWAEAGLALLAAIGVDAWRRPTGRGRIWAQRGLVAAVAVALGAGASLFILTDLAASYARATAAAGFWALGIGILSLLAPPRWQERREFTRWHWAVVIWVAADLLVAGWGLNPGASLALYRTPAGSAGELRAALAGRRLYLPDEDVQALMYTRFFDFKSFTRDEPWQDLRQVYLPDAAMLDGIATANNFDPLLPARYVRWMDGLQALDPAEREARLAFMGVGAVLTVDAGAEGGVRIASNPGAERVHWFECASAAVDEEDAWAQVNAKYASGNGPNGLVVLEGAPLSVKPCTSTNGADFRIIEEYPGRKILEGSAAAAGWLVLADTWYPGWQAQLDGKVVPILRADTLFRAVAVPPGEHRIEMDYRPPTFTLGAAISLMTSLLMAAVLFWTRRRR